jgi:predicted RNA-binding protein YlqC (UPF0109 family)
MDVTEKLLGDILRSFVSVPEEVETFASTQTDDKGELTVINVRVNKADVGICIGERGYTAEAMRRLIGIVGFKQSGERVYVKIDAPKIPPNHYA